MGEITLGRVTKQQAHGLARQIFSRTFFALPSGRKNFQSVSSNNDHSGASSQFRFNPRPCLAEHHEKIFIAAISNRNKKNLGRFSEQQGPVVKILVFGGDDLRARRSPLPDLNVRHAQRMKLFQVNRLMAPLSQPIPESERQIRVHQKIHFVVQFINTVTYGGSAARASARRGFDANPRSGLGSKPQQSAGLAPPHPLRAGGFWRWAALAVGGQAHCGDCHTHVRLAQSPKSPQPYVTVFMNWTT